LPARSKFASTSVARPFIWLDFLLHFQIFAIGMLQQQQAILLHIDGSKAARWSKKEERLLHKAGHVPVLN